ncbi:MAG: hypothetical protein ACLFPQ_04270 [Candidatus Woesearchaeota archaeon]
MFQKKKLSLVFLFLILLILPQSIAIEEDEEIPDIIAEIEDATNLSLRNQGDLLPKKSSGGFNLQEIEYIMWVMLIGFFIIIVLSAVFSMHKVNPLFLIVISALVVFIFLMFSSLTINKDNPFARAFLKDAWNEMAIDDFKLEELEDIKLKEKQEDREIISEKIDKYLTSPEEFTEARSYEWIESKRQVIVVEFIDQPTLYKYAEKYLKPNYSFTFSTEKIFQIEFEEEKDYPNAIYFNEDRFLFLIFGETEYSENAIDKIVETYPKEESFFKDTQKPIITILQPADNGFTDSKDIIFEITDNSQIELNTIEIKNLNIFDPSLNCQSIRKGYACSIRNINQKQGQNTITITAEDKSGNRMKKTIDFIYDQKLPEMIDFNIEDYSYINNNFISFSVKDDISGINIKKSTATISGYKESLNSHCNKVEDYLFCNIDAGNHLKQGLNKVHLEIKDMAGNSLFVTSNFNYDNAPPEITLKMPSEEKRYHNKKIISFSVKDMISGTKEILVKGTKGFKSKEDNCKQKAKIHECTFEGEELRQGMNTLLIISTDNLENENSESINFIYDTEEPEIRINTNEITNKKNLEIKLKDKISDIDMQFLNTTSPDSLKEITDLNEICLRTNRTITCSFDDVLEEGFNNIKIEIRDLAGNYKNIEENIIYDIRKPSIDQFEINNNRVIIEISDDIKLNEENIIIEGITGFDPKRDCSGSQLSMACSFIINEQLSETATLHIEDSAGNKDSFTISI